MTGKIKKIICTSIFVYFVKLQSVISLTIKNNDQDVQQVVLPNDADPPISFTNLKDSYGNPLTLRHKNSNIENNGRSRVIEANGYLFQIPSYASGITNIELPSDKLVPPLVSGELNNAEDIQLHLDLLPPFPTKNKDGGKNKQDTTTPVKTKPQVTFETTKHLNSSESKKDNNSEVRNIKISEFNEHKITEHEEYTTKHITADLFPTKNTPNSSLGLFNNLLNENFFDSTSTETVLTTITDLNTSSINGNLNQDLSRTTTDIISTIHETNDELLNTVTPNIQPFLLLENNITSQEELLKEYTPSTEKYISSESATEMPPSLLNIGLSTTNKFPYSRLDTFQTGKPQNTLNHEFTSTTDSSSNGILNPINQTLFSSLEEVTIESHTFNSNTTFSDNEDLKLNKEHETTTQQIFPVSKIQNSQLEKDRNFVVTDKEISLPLSGMTTPSQFAETDKKQINENLKTSSQFPKLSDKTNSLITEIPLFSLKTTISEITERDGQITSSTFPPNNIVFQKKFTESIPPSEYNVLEPVTELLPPLENNVLEPVTELLPPLEEIATQPTPSTLQTTTVVNCNLGKKCKPDCFIANDCKSIQNQTDTAQTVQGTQIPLTPHYTVYHFDLSTPKEILSIPDFIQKNPFFNKLPTFSDSKNVQLQNNKPFPLIFQQNAFPFTHNNQEKQNEQENNTPLTVNRISNPADINQSVVNNNTISTSPAKTSQNNADSSQGLFPQKPEKQFKYTGGFGGTPGVLGEQKIPGYAIQADGTIKDPDHQYQPEKIFQPSIISPTNQFSQQLSQSNEANIDKYKGGFGGPPGLLIPYDNKQQ